MRMAYGTLVLALFGSLAFGNDPGPTTTAPVAAGKTQPLPASDGTTAPVQVATAASQPAPAAGAPTDPDALEKHFVAEGYRVEMHDGTKMFCRREQVIGTRLGGHSVCGTLDQVQATELASKNSLDYMQHVGVSAPIPAPPKITPARNQ